jgi:hypothetical protein
MVPAKLVSTMRSVAILGVVVACGGTDTRAQAPTPSAAGPSMPVLGLEAATRGATAAQVLAAFPGAQLRGDGEIVVERARVEERPASVSFTLVHGGLFAATIDFGEACDEYKAVQSALSARFGRSGALEEYLWTWRVDDWDVQLECHSADTSGWLHLSVKPSRT